MQDRAIGRESSSTSSSNRSQLNISLSLELLKVTALGLAHDKAQLRTRPSAARPYASFAHILPRRGPHVTSRQCRIPAASGTRVRSNAAIVTPHASRIFSRDTFLYSHVYTFRSFSPLFCFISHNRNFALVAIKILCSRFTHAPSLLGTFFSLNLTEHF